MAELKTKVTEASVTDFLNTVENEQKRNDCYEILAIMEAVTGSKAKMWGKAIIGVGNYIYKYPNGKTMDWFPIGFSPRKQNIALYILGCDTETKPEILSRLGKHETGKGCVYIKKLDDIDRVVFKEFCSWGLTHNR